MDLTSVPGIGPEYRRRLKEAGVPDVEALASIPDLPALSEKTGIPLARLAAIYEAALDLGEDAGIAITTAQPFQEAAQTLWRAMEDVRLEAETLVENVGDTLRGRALDVVSALEGRLAAVRHALMMRPPRSG